MEGIRRLMATRDSIKEVRGKGLLIGVELALPAAPVVDACREAGLLALTAGDMVLRLVPPLVVDEGACDRALSILDRVLARNAA